MDIDELAHTLGVVFCGSPFGDLNLTPGPMRVEEDEQVDRSVAFIFAVGAFDLARRKLKRAQILLAADTGASDDDIATNDCWKWTRTAAASGAEKTIHSIATCS